MSAASASVNTPRTLASRRYSSLSPTEACSALQLLRGAAVLILPQMLLLMRLAQVFSLACNAILAAVSLLLLCVLVYPYHECVLM